MGDASAYRDSMDQDIIQLEAGWIDFIKKLALDPLEVVYTYIPSVIKFLYVKIYFDTS